MERKCGRNATTKNILFLLKKMLHYAFFMWYTRFIAVLNGVAMLETLIMQGFGTSNTMSRFDTYNIVREFRLRVQEFRFCVNNMVRKFYADTMLLSRNIALILQRLYARSMRSARSQFLRLYNVSIMTYINVSITHSHNVFRPAYHPWHCIIPP
jgi:hypothetical protein